MGKFKVGDVVEDISGLLDGCIVTVVGVRGDEVEIEYGGGTTGIWPASDYKLVEPAPLTIEAGKFYKTRDGRKVGPAHVDVPVCDSYPVCASDHWYTSAGKSCVGDEDSDIIAEWVGEPTTPTPTTGFTIPLDDEEPGWYATELGRAYADGYAAGLKAGSDEADSKLKVTIKADTSALDDEIDRVLARLKKLNKKALKSGVVLSFSELQDAA